MISFPVAKDKWMKTNEPVVQLTLPFRKNTLEVDASRQMLKDSAIVSAIITIAGVQNGQNKQFKKLILRPGDAESVSKAIIFRDENTPVVYTVKWYTNKGTYQEAISAIDMQTGDSGYI